MRQRYDGPSRWEFLRELKQHAGSLVVLGSGDLFSAQACLDMIEFTGVDGVTVARGAIGNPWIFAQCRALAAGEPLPQPPTLRQQRDVITEHYRLAEELYGPERCLPDMRKFAIKYSQLHPCHAEVRADFCQVKLPGAWRDVLSKWYAVDGPGNFPSIEEPNPRSSDAAGLHHLREVVAGLRAAGHPIGPDLSMGMSDDYPIAVEEGATIVRVGRALFGERRPPDPGG